MGTSYVPPAPPGAATVTIRVNDKTTLRVGPVPGRDRVWIQLTYASTFVVAVLDVDQVARLIVALRRAGVGADASDDARARRIAADAVRWAAVQVAPPDPADDRDLWRWADRIASGDMPIPEVK